MSKSAKGAAAAKLVQDATSAPGVFVFSELLELPNIQELATNEQLAKFYTLLELFAYRTYTDYLQHKDSLPPLNQAQITKLKHLTLISLAMDRRVLPYAQLLQTLQMPTIRDLEDLIIDAIYQDVIRGKLDQKGQQFDVEYTMGRDVEPGKIESLLVALQDWASTTAAVLSTLDDRLSTLTRQAAAEKKAKSEYETVYHKNLKEMADKQREAKFNASRVGVKPTLPSGPSAAGLAFAEREKERERLERERERENGMDVDDPTDPKGKNKKTPAPDPSKNRKRNRF